MRSTRPEQAAQVALLQSLRARASTAKLADAIEASGKAEAHLDQCDAVLDEAEAAFEHMLSADALDLDSWRIGGAELDRLAQLRDHAVEEAREQQEGEARERDRSHRERELEKQATHLCRDARRRAAAKRDDKAAMEAVSLALALKAGEGE